MTLTQILKLVTFVTSDYRTEAEILSFSKIEQWTWQRFKKTLRDEGYLEVRDGNKSRWMTRADVTTLAASLNSASTKYQEALTSEIRNPTSEIN